ncbi:MAG: hypothetical protein J6N70_07745 [Oribacterium sp.]|nr:hypothetical protein [Oribacterium sp.]
MSQISCAKDISDELKAVMRVIARRGDIIAKGCSPCKRCSPSLQYYEGEIIDIAYDDYIRQKLG